MSIAWCHGNKKGAIEEKLFAKKSVMEILSDNSAFSISVNAYVFKTGFKEFILNLQWFGNWTEEYLINDPVIKLSRLFLFVYF